MSGYAGSSKPVTKGKEQILCYYCDKETRKDNLERHTKAQHPGKPPKLKLKTVGTQSLIKFVSSGSTTDDTNNNKDKLDYPSSSKEAKDEAFGKSDTEESDKDNDSIIEHGQKRKLEIKDDDDDGKKQRTEDDATRIEEQFDTLGRTIKEHIDKKIETVIDHIKKADTFKPEEQVEVAITDSKSSIDEVFGHAKDIEGLEKVLVDHSIKKEFDIKPSAHGYFCEICFGDTHPNFENLSPGLFIFDTTVDNKYPTRNFRNLKINIKKHLTENKFHKEKQEILKNKTKLFENLKSRQEKVGLNIFRIRYNAIKQGKSLQTFESDITQAHLNGVDVGDINHSHKFTAGLDKAIYETMKDDLQKNMNTVLDATNNKRPAGIVFDKMTPNKRTGQIHGLIIPVPENPLGSNLVEALMLDVPVVRHHDVESLAVYAKDVFTNSGCEDEQFEGMGVDGEYIKKGVKRKFIEMIEIENMNTEEKDLWLTARWEPAHQLELTTKDTRKLDAFVWLETMIENLNEITKLLNIGKGLEQSYEAAEELDETFYKLRPLSDTRFVAYFERSISNFEKRLDITIEALRKRTESKDKDVKTKAAHLLNSICNKEFLLTNLGLLDIYSLLGSVSSNLQTVQQFPWDIPKQQDRLIKTMRRMERLSLTEDDSGDLSEIDESDWKNLGDKIEYVINDKYLKVATAVTFSRRRGRSAADISASNSMLKTVENRLRSIAKHLANSLEKRLQEEPNPKVIKLMGECLDMEEIISNKDMKEKNEEMEKSLKKLCRLAKYCDEKTKNIGHTLSSNQSSIK